MFVRLGFGEIVEASDLGGYREGCLLQGGSFDGRDGNLMYGDYTEFHWWGEWRPGSKRRQAKPALGVRCPLQLMYMT